MRNRRPLVIGLAALDYFTGPKVKMYYSTITLPHLATGSVAAEAECVWLRHKRSGCDEEENQTSCMHILSLERRKLGW